MPELALPFGEINLDRQDTNVFRSRHDTNKVRVLWIIEIMKKKLSIRNNEEIQNWKFIVKIAGNRDLSINENDFCCYFTMTETYRVM